MKDLYVKTEKIIFMLLGVLMGTLLAQIIIFLSML